MENQNQSETVEVEVEVEWVEVEFVDDPDFVDFHCGVREF